jgi:MoxR-like ATPase
MRPEKSKLVVEEVGRVIVGKQDVLKKIMVSILAGGHVLFEDYPGLAKTMIVRCFSQTLGCDFSRIQFTPDLLPSDITGTYVFNQKTGEFQLRRGPLFANIILADEINRAPPKTQAALLEAMQEKQVTLEGKTRKLAEPFIVFATQNPIEYEGTYPLPEAQLDRFLMRISVGYPTHDQEKEIIDRRIQRKKEEFNLRTMVSTRELVGMQQACEHIFVHESIKEYIVDIVTKTRGNTSIEVGASPRASLALMRLGRAHAAYEARDFVIPDDVKMFASEVLSHRIILKQELWYRRVSPISVIGDLVESIPVPKAEPL